jgi:hypothetical protein
MPGREPFERAWWLVSGDVRAGNDAVDGAVILVMIERGGHWPRRFANNNGRVWGMTAESAARERTRDESNGIDGVHRRTKDFLEIGSKPQKGTAQ